MKIPDFLINILIPLASGAAIYLWVKGGGYIPVIKHFVPDLLWAYALASAILIIWKRKPNYTWLAVAFLSGFLFEWLQFLNIINGTGDLQDLLAYSGGFVLPVFLNKTFMLLFKP